MGISEYENIEIFINTQSFGINKCENQILRDFIYEYESYSKKMLKITSCFLTTGSEMG